MNKDGAKEGSHKHMTEGQGSPLLAGGTGLALGAAGVVQLSRPLIWH